MIKKITAVLLAFMMLLALLPMGGALADSAGLYVLINAPSTVKTKTGERYTLNLTNVFCDSEGHELTYALTGVEINQHTKIADGVFYFSVQNAGSYPVTLTATCAEHGTVSHTITFTVETAGHGLDSQYNYDETPAESVTVYFTLSSDGVPILAEDGTPLAHLEITVPYFDLALYGLQQYYRYHTKNGSGPYIDDIVIERPTGLHLYIYVLERYYMGLDEEDCCKGTSGVLQYNENKRILNINEETAYNTNGLNAIIPTQNATSLYMTNFWGHDENLMYYRNHVYPYMSAGWGATSDYILLSDGDTWDVAMFSDWDFWNQGGAFVSFDKDTYTVKVDEFFTVQTRKYGTTSANSNFAPIDADRMDYVIIDAENGSAGGGADITGTRFSIAAPSEPGEYILVGIDVNGNTPAARLAPPTAKLIVIPLVTYGDVNESGGIDITDVQLTCKHILGKQLLDASAAFAADVDGSGTVDITDVQLMCKFILGKISAFPVQS